MAHGLLICGGMRHAACTTALLLTLAATPALAQEPTASRFALNEEANMGLWNTGLALTIGGAIPILAGALVLGIGVKEGCSDDAGCGLEGGVMSVTGGALVGLGLAVSLTGIVLLKFVTPGADDTARRTDDAIALTPWVAPRPSEGKGAPGAVLGVVGTF
jgi:hypothetical protein